jgi:aldose 1-epimerase
MIPLSGEQIEIQNRNQRAAVSTTGATLRAYSFGDRPVLDGFNASEVCPGACGQVMAPWPNRIADGRYDFAGENHQLPIDEPELGNAIHGLVRWNEWDVEHQAADRVCFGHRLCAQPGYPFPLDLSVEYRLARSGLVVTFRAVNLGESACPFGFGAHPYYLLRDRAVEAVELCVPAREWLDIDERAIPTAHRPVAGSPLDFREPHRIGKARLDHAFTGLDRDRQEVAEVTLRDETEEIHLWQDRMLDFVHIYTGDTLPEPERRRRSVAVEPMTCAPNAFNSGDGLRLLYPGIPFECRWGIEVSNPGSSHSFRSCP